MLGRNEFVLESSGQLFGLSQHLLQFFGDLGPRAAGHLRRAIELGTHERGERLYVPADLQKQGLYDAALFLEQRVQQMQRVDLRTAAFQRRGLRVGYGLLSL